MKLKNILKELIVDFIYKIFYRPKSTNKIKYDEKINVNKDSIVLINQSTFKVYKIIIDNKNYYFRQIRRHLCFKDYLKNVLDDYYLFLAHDNNIMIENKQLVYNTILTKKTINKIYYMGKVYDTNSKIYYFFNTLDYNIFSINALKIIGDENILNLFQYIWGEVLLYRLNIGVKEGNYETMNANKAIATKKISLLLGVSNLIPNIKLIKLIIDNKIVKYGTLMDEVPGISSLSINKINKTMISNSFKIDCINLNILDAVNNEKDHRPSNYNVQYKNGLIDALQSFDNDSPAAFNFSSSINLKSYCGSGPLINKKGLINYKQIEDVLYNGIVHVNKKELYKAISNELTFAQKHFLWIRFFKMKKAFRKSYANGLTIINRNNVKYISESNKNFTSYIDVFVNFDNKNNDFDVNRLIKNRRDFK